VRIRHGRALAPLAAALAMAAVLLPAWSVAPARAADDADTQASAVVWLINGERAYRGKAALSVDPYLTAKARDGAVWCPNDSSLVMAGRANDMAVNGYLSHDLRLCTKYSIIDAMATWGYTGGRGEIISYNSVGVHTVDYAYGCSPSVATCPGSTTTTYNTVARAMSGWMRSSLHYSIITGSYNRVGCGAWVSSGGVYYYACLFALGGNPIVTARPKATPGPVVTPKPTAQATAEAPLTPTDPVPTPLPTPSGLWLAAQDPVSPIEGNPAANGADGGIPAAIGPQGGPPFSPERDADDGLPQAAQAVLAAAGMMGMLAVVWLRLGSLRRYRTRGPGTAPPLR
jgi:uncharacterized protein YkwD